MTAIANVLVAPTKADVPTLLNDSIVPLCAAAIANRGIFTIALSGGSLPSFLSTLQESFEKAQVPPEFDKWHVLLADERCVVSTDPDSNLGALQEKLFSNVSIPASQIYGINETKLKDSNGNVDVHADAVAKEYELVVKEVLGLSGGMLDVAVLGFGPDGHTCSLFPNHPLLQEHSKWVAPIADSPKPPLYRITLTLSVLNSKTRHVLFCGAGASKAPILKAVFASLTQVGSGAASSSGSTLTATMAKPDPLYPCGMVLPTATKSSQLIWVVDAEALTGVSIVTTVTTTTPTNKNQQQQQQQNQQVTAKVLVAPTKAEVPSLLNAQLVDACQEAIANRGVFTIALSGGSLPSFLSTCNESFHAKGVEPCFDRWHVILADERCVVSTDPDSNLGALQDKLFSKVPVPKSQIYGINETKLLKKSTDATAMTDAVAKEYELVVKEVLGLSGGMLDAAVLGFGPDGHTCSLFPNHPLLQEYSKWVAPITDSPKPPPNRITLTYPVLNGFTRTVIFCGAGDSKAPILKAIFEPLAKVGDSCYDMKMKDPAPYPCAKVVPTALGTHSKLIWVVDEAAMPEYRFAS
jgi:6-phosphogluconolactonase